MAILIGTTYTMGATLCINALLPREQQGSSPRPRQRLRFTQCVIAKCGTYPMSRSRGSRRARLLAMQQRGTRELRCSTIGSAQGLGRASHWATAVAAMPAAGPPRTNPIVPAQTGLGTALE